MGISFKAFKECIGFVAAIKKPVLLRSRHGVGKSAIVYQYAESIGKKIIERRISQMTEGDIIGLPKLSDKGTEWILPDWLLEACTNPRVLFLDEVDRGTTEVRQSIFELTDSRKIAGHYLHPDTEIFAAINGGQNSSQYQVGEMDPAELDRWTVFDIEPTVEDWLNWAKEDNNIHQLIWDFINQNNNQLEHNNDFEPNKVYPSRRSWHRLSDCIKTSIDQLIQRTGAQHDETDKVQLSPVLLNLVNAFVGLEATVALGDFIKNYNYQLTADDIINKGLIDKTKLFQINDHLVLVERLITFLKDPINIKLPKKQLFNIAAYFITLPSEIAMKLFEGLANINIEMLKSFHKIPGVKDYLVKILTAHSQTTQTTDTTKK